MKGKWDTRVYVELYAGAGYNRIRDTDLIIAGSPIRALTVLAPACPASGQSGPDAEGHFLEMDE